VLIINGIKRYSESFENPFQNSQNSVLFFPGGHIEENGFKSACDSFSNFFLAVEYPSGEVKYSTNIQNINERPSQDYFKNVLCRSPKSNASIGIWVDEITQKFLLFRNTFGAIPLFYIHIPNILFAFSTDFANLLRCKLVRKHLSINLSKIALHMSHRHPDVKSEVLSSIFTEIKCCPPGHLLTVDSRHVSCTLHSSFNPEKWEHIKTFETAGEIIRMSLSKAVANMTMGSYVVGSHLSGGLDSSSISSMFRHLYPDRPLHTFHIAANNHHSDESFYSSLVAKDVSAIHHEIRQPLEDLSYLELSTGIYGQPESSYLSPASNLKLIGEARDLDCKVLLNGHGGDSIIGNGMELLWHSFAEKNWSLTRDLLAKRTSFSPLSTQYHKWNDFSFQKKYHLVLQNFLYGQLPAFRALPVIQLFNLYREVSSGLGISYYYFAKRASFNFLMRALRKGNRGVPTILRDELLREHVSSNGLSLPDLLRGDLPSKHQDMFSDVFKSYTIKGQENFFTLSNHFGVSNRSPFMNHELFEISLAIPNIVKFGNGIGRAHLREAMKNILIDEVRTRGTKSTLSSPDGEEMTLRLFYQAQHYLQDSTEVWQYVDKKKFNDEVKILKNKTIPTVQKTATLLHITRTISLSVWLEWWRRNR